VRVERDGYATFASPLPVDGPVVRLPIELKPSVAAAPTHHRSHHGAEPAAPAAEAAPAPEAPKPVAKPSRKKTPADDDGTMVPPPP